MKRILLTLLLLSAAVSSWSQSVEQYVVVAGADSSSNVPGYSIHFTIGETIIGTTSTRYMMVTQGFEQATLDIKNSVQLTGRFNGSHVDLSWLTPYEVNVDHFVVERASDTVNAFQQMAIIKSKSPDGNSNALTTYTSIDSFPLQTVNYYRAKMVSRDNKITYSNTIALIMEGTDIWIENLYPNPASTNVNLKIFAQADTKTAVSIIDAIGRTMMNQPLELKKGSNLKTLNVASLAAATYFVYVADIKTGKRLVAKMIKVNQ